MCRWAVAYYIFCSPVGEHSAGGVAAGGSLSGLPLGVHISPASSCTEGGYTSSEGPSQAVSSTIRASRVDSQEGNSGHRSLCTGGFLVPTIPGTLEDRRLASYYQLETSERSHQASEVQDGDPSLGPTLPYQGHVGHESGSQGLRALPRSPVVFLFFAFSLLQFC